MKIKVSELRYCNVLPAKLIETLSFKKLTGIRFLPEFYEKVRKWWEAEQHIELTFDEEPTQNDTKKIGETCGACGDCCKDIPTHQIGIYISGPEHQRAMELFPEREILQGMIQSDGAYFGVVDVKENGDCILLGPKGCELGDDRPLWCKIYHCEKYQGQPYQFAKGTK